MQNPDIARLFDEVSDLLEIKGENPFRIRAYRNAARTIRDFPEPLSDVVARGTPALTDLPGIGSDLAEKISTIIATGELPLHKQLAAKLPSGLLDLLRIPGLGPKRVKLLYTRLKIRSAADLAKALAAGRVRKLKGFGPKMVEKIQAGLPQAHVGEQRLLLHDAETEAQAIEAHLEAGGGISAIAVAGSFRRRRETVGDLDVLVTCADSTAVMQRFVTYPDSAEVLAHGDTRSTIRLRGGLQVDLRAVEPAAYGAALQYFTGSKAHNVELRQLAQSKHLKLNEYGLFKGTRRVAGKTEEEIYEALGLDWIPPELREARGEIALARAHRLPTLVAEREIRGDMQMHTKQPTAKGRLQTWPNRRPPGLRVHRDHGPLEARDDGSGARRDAPAGRMGGRGRLECRPTEGDDPEERRARHLGRRQTGHAGRRARGSGLRGRGDSLRPHAIEAADHERVLGAIAHPWVDAIGHPTGRLVGKRDPSRWTSTRSPGRCPHGVSPRAERAPRPHGPPDTLAAAAKRRGVRFVLSTDSHRPNTLSFMRYAVDIARRAGLERGDIVNTRPLAGLRRPVEAAHTRGAARQG